LDQEGDDTADESCPAPAVVTDFSHIQNDRTSFTADSPYFNSFVDKEMQSINLLSEALKDISLRTKNFVQTGVRMAEATRQLAVACRLHHELDADADDDERLEEEAALKKRKEAVGEEMVTLLGLLSNVRVGCLSTLQRRIRCTIQHFPRLTLLFRFIRYWKRLHSLKITCATLWTLH
jgi:hypothetical protein